MRQGILRRSYWRRVAMSLVMAAAVGCTTLPPARPATDLKQIAGNWEGRGRTAQGTVFTITTTIKEDGSFESIVPGASNPGPRFVGTIRVEDGKFRSKSETTGRTGTWTVHEGDGRRVLRAVNDDGSSTSELRPAK